MAWRKPTLRDIAAKLNQRELDAYRQHPDFNTSADPVLDILEQTAESVRGYCRTNKTVKISPELGSIPEGLITFAMDFAAFDILKRINAPIGEPRKVAWEKAIEVFKDVAEGKFIPESYAEGSDDDTTSNRAQPVFSAMGRRKILNNYVI